MLFTVLALTTMATNTVLGRLALGGGADAPIDAASYTAIRLLTGSLVLIAILMITRKIFSPKTSDSSTVKPSTKGSWSASFMLFLYALTFSFAYITLDTGTGALILFGAVQITMIILSLITGTRLHLSEWLGVALALAGFVYLVLPGVTAPSTTGFILMTIAGIAWGLYTLKGRGSLNPLRDTAYNFIRTTPLVILLILLSFRNIHYSTEGILLAAISGGNTSGIGYTIWYIALGGLTATQAAVLQLLVPVIAALGGVVFVSEEITTRLAISSLMILGGILLVVLGRYYFVQMKSDKKTY